MSHIHAMPGLALPFTHPHPLARGLDAAGYAEEGPAAMRREPHWVCVTVGIFPIVPRVEMPEMLL